MSVNSVLSVDDFVSASRQTERLPECINYVRKWMVEDQPDSFRGALGSMIGTYSRAKATIAGVSRLLDRLYRPGTPSMRFGGFEADNAHMLCLKLATRFLQDILRICDPVRYAEAFGPEGEVYAAEFSRQSELVRDNWDDVKAAMARSVDVRDDAAQKLKAQAVRERTEIDRQFGDSSILSCEINAVLDSPDWAESRTGFRPETKADGGNGQPEEPAQVSTTVKKPKHSTEQGEGIDDGLAVRRLLRVFTGGLADDRIVQAASVLQDDGLTTNQKLTKIDKLIPFPPTVSAEKLGHLVGGVSKQAVMKTDWWIKNRKGKKESEIGRRRDKHRERAKEQGPSRTNDEDEQQ